VIFLLNCCHLNTLVSFSYCNLTIFFFKKKQVDLLEELADPEVMENSSDPNKTDNIIGSPSKKYVLSPNSYALILNCTLIYSLWNNTVCAC